MKITGLDIDEFLYHVGRVRKKLIKKRNGEKLLKEALEDVPALETLWQWIRKTATSKKRDSRRNTMLLLQMERDFLVLLALWQMEKEQEREKPDLDVVGNEADRSRRMN